MKYKLDEGMVVQLFATEGNLIVTTNAERTTWFDGESVGEHWADERYRVYFYDNPFPKYDDWDVGYIRWKKDNKYEHIIFD